MNDPAPERATMTMDSIGIGIDTARNSAGNADTPIAEKNTVIASFIATYEMKRTLNRGIAYHLHIGRPGETGQKLVLSEEDFSAFCNPVTRDRADDVLIATLEGCAQAIFGPYAIEDGLIEVRAEALRIAVANAGHQKPHDIVARAATFADFIEKGTTPEKPEPATGPFYSRIDGWLGDLGLGATARAGDPLGQGPRDIEVLAGLIRENPGWFVGQATPDGLDAAVSAELATILNPGPDLKGIVDEAKVEVARGASATA